MALNRLYFLIILLTLIISIGFLFYFAHLIPLHIDEAGFWFNYTNKSWQNRFNHLDYSVHSNGPYHTLPTYLSKLTLPVFGYNGIGLRFPAIFFGILDCLLIYFLVKVSTGSREISALASALTILNPYLNYFFHENRSYSFLFFFSTLSYLCFLKLIENKKAIKHWVLLLLSFIFCYISGTAAALIFLFVFMASFWLLRLAAPLKPLNLISLQNVSFKALFSFSIVATSFFLLIVFFVDYQLFSYSRAVGQSKPINVITIPDFFSAFLGYKFLDDPQSLIYHHPFILWLFSLVFVFVGFINQIKEKTILSCFFFTLFFVTILFYLFSGSHIYTRTAIYLLPFLISFQAIGIFKSINWFIKRIEIEKIIRLSHFYFLILLLFLYCGALYIGKIEALDAISGNPYELARKYLKENSGPDDLIISQLSETQGAFYLGEIIRDKIKNIYKKESISAIYYLSSRKNIQNIKLKPYVGSDPKLRQPFINIKYFSKVAEFENKGKRKETITVFKSRVSNQVKLNVNYQLLKKLDYIGQSLSACEKKVETDGIRLFCNQSRMACVNRPLNTPFPLKRNTFQVGIFNHRDNYANGRRSIAFLIPRNPELQKVLFDINNFANNFYILNYLIDYPDNLDRFKTNISFLAPHIQKLQVSKNLMVCMLDHLFKGNALIKGIKIFSVEINKPL